MARKNSNKLLTGSIIRKLPAPDSGNKIYYDAEVAGFGVRVTSGGARSFILNYRNSSGTERRYTIGATGDWTATDARKEARRLRRLIDEGGDPNADAQAEREAPTMAELADRFEAEHLPRKRSSTAADYRRMLHNHIRPHFGSHIKVADVVFKHIDDLHRKVTKGGSPRRANTVVAVLSKMFGLAIRWGMRSDNPCKGVERNPEIKRKRYLSGDELKRLTAALAKHPDKRSANVVRMLLLTGARRGEVLAARWADVDLGTGVWTKPGSSTKQGTDHVVPLSAPARQLLSEIREQQTAKHQALGEYVFPGNGSAGHVVEVKRAWRQLCKAAGISGLRIHDLRHSFASELASSGASLPLIGALLGHSNPTTTARYAHLFDDPLRQATERVGAILEAAANGKPAVTPTPLPVGRRGRHGR
jgi:integrase